MLYHAVNQAFDRAHKKGWDRLYVGVDVHGVIIIPTYENDGKIEFYPKAEEVMKYMTERPDLILFMYTCSHEDEIEHYIKFFECHGIRFDFVNQNPEVRSDMLGNYKYKPYANILLDDKAGFHPSEWLELELLLKSQSLLTK